MPGLRILINGGGICGPALACYLLNSTLDCHITIVERSSELRTAGQQIDLRDQGIPLMKKLDLIDTVRQRTVPEKAIRFVDSAGVQQAVFGVNDTGKGAQSLVSEFEIMRGDLVTVLYDKSLELAKKSEKQTLKYEFGKYATEFAQQEQDESSSSSSSVSVKFSDGTMGEYDLVVGADGQGSKTRRTVFPETEANGFDSKNLFLGLWTVPKSEDDERNKHAVVYQAPGRRIVAIRTAAAQGTQAMLGIMAHQDLLRDAAKSSIQDQKRLWAALYKGAGWETDRLLEGLDAADDFYMAEVGQVKIPAWSKGRVVLLGDAGYCPSPITGLGTTVSIMGAYVLAGELAAHGTGDVKGALTEYEKKLRPFVTDAQTLFPGAPGLLYPRTSFGIAVTRWILWTAYVLRLDRLSGYLAPETKSSFKVPEYAELRLQQGK